MFSSRKSVGMVAGLLLSAFYFPGFSHMNDSACAANVNVLKKHDLGVGVAWVDLKPLNDRLSNLGLSNFRLYGLSLDLEHQTIINRMMMGGELKGLLFADRLTGNTRTAFSAGEILLKSGFNVINTEHVNLYPYLGLGAGLMNLVMLPMWILSGVFFSATRFPAVIQPLVHALPLTAAIDALRANMLEGIVLSHLVGPVAVLFAWLVVPFMVSLRIFRWR